MSTHELSPDSIPARPLALTELAKERQWFAVALSSIGDAVITADLEGRITFMNPVAEALTGWSHREAAGQALDRVFHIVNEETKSPVQNPALRAMREGTVFGLANHTVLVARDGREIAIDDSGAPIRTETGELLGAVLVFRDVAERRHAEEARALLAGIVESSEDTIVSKNLNGIVTSWNTSAERMFGYTAAEAIGQPMTALIIPPERREEEAMILTRLRHGERIEHFETERVTKDGRLVPISLTVSPVRNRYGEIVGASKIARDISERLRNEAERAHLLARERAARERAEAASRAKDEFVAMISHEIRSPLNAILGWAQTLRHRRGDATALDRALDSIERNARAQVQLIDDLLDVSRAITGKLQLNTRPVDVRRSLDSALESIRPAADAKLITIQVQREPRRALVTGDPDRLQQILWNLLSNAVKFTPKQGHISVTIARLNSHLEIRVSDSGKGIHADFLPSVFDRFAQADTGSTRTHGGLGLGLAIVRHLVELHGGSVSAASAGEGQGATFTVRLPVRAIDEEANDSSSDQSGLSVETLAFRTMLEGLRVMLVDDEKETRDLLSTLLQSHRADVLACVSAADALASIEDWKPDILVSDIGMPEEDGYGLIGKVRKLSSNQRHVPAVALTAYARLEDRVQALGAGFQMHVPKPVEVAELLLVLATLAGRHPSRA